MAERDKRPVTMEELLISSLAQWRTLGGEGGPPLVDGERYSGRPAAPSSADAAPLRNAAALGATDRAARVSRAGVAGTGHVTARLSSDEGDALARSRRWPCGSPICRMTSSTAADRRPDFVNLLYRTDDPYHLPPITSHSQVSKKLGVQLFPVLVQNGLRGFDESGALRVGQADHLVL
jgi:hypothetical protein